MTAVHEVAWRGWGAWGDLAAACRSWPADDVVVLHRDGTAPDDAAIDALLVALEGALGAASFEPLTDAVKEVDAGGMVVGAPDRSRFGRLGLPQALRAGTLAELDGPGGASGRTPADVLVATGATVRVVPRPA